MDYSREEEDIFTPEAKETRHDDALGYNVGGGFEVPLNHHLAVLAEYTHTFSDLKDNIVFVGVVYEFELGQKNHSSHQKHGEE